jgi:hypothetical protein
MHPTDKAARVAGAVYLSMAVTAPFSLIYILRTLIVRVDERNSRLSHNHHRWEENKWSPTRLGLH